MTDEFTPRDMAAHFAPMASLYKKKAKVMELLKPVQKNGRTDKFAYMTASDIKQAVQQAMAEANLSLSISLTGYEIEPTEKGRRTLAKFAITLCDGDSGASETSEWIGIGSDFGQDDKGFNKASTSALKYFLAATFLVSSAEDASDVSSSRRASQSPAEKPPAQKPAAKEPSTDAPPWWTPVMKDLKIFFNLDGVEWDTFRSGCKQALKTGVVSYDMTEAQARTALIDMWTEIVDARAKEDVFPA